MYKKIKVARSYMTTKQLKVGKRMGTAIREGQRKKLKKRTSDALKILVRVFSNGRGVCRYTRVLI
jgi:hypothetical protein